MQRKSGRRRFLTVLASGAVVGLAGCSDDSGGDETTDGDDGDDPTTADDGGTVTTEAMAGTTTEAQTTEARTTEEQTTAEQTTESQDSGIDTAAPDGVFGQFQADPQNTGLSPDTQGVSGVSMDWQFPDEPGDAMAGLTYADGALFTMIRSGSTQTLYALNAANGEVLNEKPISSALMPIYRNGTLYHGDGTAQGQVLRALSPGDFSEQWTGTAGFSGTTELTITDDAVYGYNTSGGDDIVRSLSTADGSVRWEQSVTFSGFTSPSPVAVGSDHVFAPGDSLDALARSDGSQQWSVDASGPYTSAPLVAGDAVYVGTDGGNIVGYSTADGSEVLNARTPSSFEIDTPMAYSDGLLIGVGSFSVFAIDPESGDLVWQGEQNLGSALTVAGDHLLGLRTSGQRVVGLNRSDGSMAWQAGPSADGEGLVGGGRVFAIGDRVYAGFNGQVVALS